MTLEEKELSRIAYFRVSTADQSVEAQRTAMHGTFDREFIDVAVSGGIMAQDRPGFAEMLRYVREGDTLHVYAVDRLGRDAIDVQANVRALIDKGVTVDIHGLGPVQGGVGQLIVAVLAQVAAMERARILDRCNAGRAAAKISLAETGSTHRGKPSLGRLPVQDAVVVRKWRTENQASINGTARQFGISPSTVKRYCRHNPDRGQTTASRPEN